MVPLPVVKISKYCLCFVFSLPLGDLFKLDCLIKETKFKAKLRFCKTYLLEGPNKI